MAHSNVIELNRSPTGMILGDFLVETNFEIHYFPRLIQTDIMTGNCHNGATKQSRLMAVDSDNVRLYVLVYLLKFRLQEAITMLTPLQVILNVSIISVCLTFSSSISLWAADQEKQAINSQKVLVTVNGQTITQADLDFAFLSRGIANNQRPAKQQVLKSLVNQRLIQDFLTLQKITVPPQLLDESVLRIEKLIRKKGDDPEKVLSRMGFTPGKLRTAIALPLSWNIYARREITAAKIQEYFNKHREELDGTRVEASHILLKLPKNPDQKTVKQSTQKLADLREKILAKKLSFTEAASQHSEAPSKNQGGKLVTSAYRGKMPLALTQQVFPLKVGEISAPFQTPFGVHIVTLNKKHPGQFSLEDVRGEIFLTLSRALWDTTIQSLHSKAKIEWNAENTK